MNYIFSFSYKGDGSLLLIFLSRKEQTQLFLSSSQIKLHPAEKLFFFQEPFCEIFI